MSRLMVKNLPSNVTKEALLEKFSQKGLVTDVQLKHDKKGKFRHFGFVGFKSAEDASKALEYFDNSFINASKIRVELCAELGDTSMPTAWCQKNKDIREKIKRREAEKEREAKEGPKAIKEPTAGEHKMHREKPVNPEVAELLAKHKNDPLFREFMEVHAGGDKTLWDNDLISEMIGKENNDTSDPEYEEPIDIQPTTEKDTGQESDESELPVEQNKVAEEKISDLEYLKRMMVKDTGETNENNSGTETDLKKKTRKGGRNAEAEIGDKGTDLTKATKDTAQSVEADGSDNETTDKKPPRIKMPKQKKKFEKLFTVKISGLSFKETKKELKQFFHPMKLASVRLPRKVSGFAYIGLKTEKEMRQALSKDHSFLGGKRISVSAYTKKEADDAEDDNAPKWHAQAKSLKDEEGIAESGRIFVRNLSYTTTEADLEVLFNAFGDTTEVSMPTDRNTRLPKGFAQVTYMIPENAVKAFNKLDGTVFNGRMLHLLPGKAKVSLEEAMEQDGLSFSDKKHLKQKMQSGSSHNWNSLFLGLNAVADVMAATYNTSKEQVLDARGSESLAVRLALGETQIVTQTKDFLVNNGVRLDAFNQAPKQRSKTVVLVKNLPAKTTEKEIVDLFAPHAQLQRVILPPSGVTAIIEFLEPFEARKAFTRLAYTKFKNLPLYLEWAPLDTFYETLATPKPDTDVNTLKEGNVDTSKEENTMKHDESEASKHDSKQPETPAEDQDEPPEPDTTLYVKNLNFKTTEEDLRQHFKKCGTVHSVTISYKRSKDNMSQSLSMGYGFVRFKKNAGALLALKTLNNVPLQEHCLEIVPSHRTVATEVASARKKTVIGKQNGSKILVRNIPFQANYQEIKDLFKTFGELKAVRLPKKMTGTGPHRGFVFIEYESKSDAKRAFDALSQSTHLYGRRLVLEWAAKDDDVADLRKRTANQFFSGPSKEKSMRTSTMNIDDADMADYDE